MTTKTTRASKSATKITNKKSAAKPAKAAKKKRAAVASKPTTKPSRKPARKKAPPKPSISVVVVTRDATEPLRTCLETLARDGYSRKLSAKKGNREVFVVDAGSGDHTPKMMASEFPDVPVIHRPDNAGSARSTNLAVDAASGKYVVLLDPETVISKGTIAKLVDYMENHLHVGAVSPEVIDENGNCLAGPERFPSLREEFAREWQPVAQRVGVAADPTAAPETACSVDWVARHCMVIRRNALEQVGRLDDGYSMYYAEADWCRRARRVGWGIHFHPGVTVTSKQSGSFVRESLKGWSKHQFESSRRHYFRKHHGVPVAALVDALHGLRSAAEATKAILDRARNRSSQLGKRWSGESSPSSDLHGEDS